MLLDYRIITLLLIATFVLQCKATVEDIWLIGMVPFTGLGWDSGESLRFGAEIMLEHINNATNPILPGYKLNVMWQDERCSGTRARYILDKNLGREQYFIYEDLPHDDVNGDGIIRTS